MSVKSNNLVVLRGHLGADPEDRRTPNGARVVEMRMATASRWRTSEGERRERTDWHRVSAFGHNADYAATYLRKGDLVQVLGSIRNDVVGEGENRRKYSSVMADEVTGLNRRRWDDRASGGGVQDQRDGPPPNRFGPQGSGPPPRPRFSGPRPAFGQEQTAGGAWASDGDAPKPKEDDIPF